MATRTGMSIEEFLAGDWPADTELVDGEVVTNDPSFRHQRICSRIHGALWTWIREGEGRGDAGWGGNWTLAPGQVYKPDVWWAAEESQPGAAAIRSDSPPTIAIEVRSPGTWHLDRGRKRDVYETAGVAELWLVNTPARIVQVSRRREPGAPRFDITVDLGPGDTLTSPLLDGFSQPLDELFADRRDLGTGRRNCRPDTAGSAADHLRGAPQRHTSRSLPTEDAGLEPLTPLVTLKEVEAIANNAVDTPFPDPAG